MRPSSTRSGAASTSLHGGFTFFARRGEKWADQTLRKPCAHSRRANLHELNASTPRSASRASGCRTPARPRFAGRVCLSYWPRSRVTAAVRVCTPSFAYVFSRCLRTVPGESQRICAISAFVLPRSTHSRISRSRRVRGSSATGTTRRSNRSTTRWRWGPEELQHEPVALAEVALLRVEEEGLVVGRARGRDPRVELVLVGGG